MGRLCRIGALAGALALAACQGSGSGGRGLASGSPAGVPIAIDSLDGPPAPVQTALAGELASAASSRRVELAGADTPARYRVRGYLSTEPNAEGGSSLAYVWEVFDADRRRARRLTGTTPLRTSADSWDGLDREALAKLAAQSMDEIAVFLAEVKARGGTAVTAEAETGAAAVAQ